MDRKKRYFNRMLMVCGGSALLAFGIYVIYMKRAPRYYYIPKDYSGWVTVKFEKEGAPELPEVDGVQEVRIPANGILETSSRLSSGWARDEFYFVESDGNAVEIPRQVEVADEARRQVHDRTEEPPDYSELMIRLPDGVDTLLEDGTRISKSGQNVEIRTGRNRLEHFFISAEPEPFFFDHDSLPDERKIW